MAEAQTSTSNQQSRALAAAAAGTGTARPAVKGAVPPASAAASSSSSSPFPYHDTNACNLLLTEVSKRRRFDLAYTFLSLMHELGLRADTVSYNILMDLALKVNECGGKGTAASVLASCRTASTLSLRSCSVLVPVPCLATRQPPTPITPTNPNDTQVKRPSKVRELLAEMQGKGIPPGVITYNILLSACAAVEDRAEVRPCVRACLIGRLSVYGGACAHVSV